MPVLLAIAALACNPDGFEGADTGTAGVGAEPAPGCEQVDLVSIASPGEPVEGAWVQAADLLAEHEGTWVGVLETGDGATFDLTLTLAWDGEALTWIDLAPAVGGTGTWLGAPSSTCADEWVLGLTARLDALPEVALDGLALSFLATADGIATFGGQAEPEDVEGDTAPSFDPADWDRIFLAVYGNLEDGAWMGTLTWNGANDTTVTVTGGAGTAGGATAGTGVATAPSGTVEPAGTFAVARP